MSRTHSDLFLEFECLLVNLWTYVLKEKKINDVNVSQMLHFAKLFMWKQTIAYSCIFLLCSSTLSVFCHCAFSYQPVEFSSWSLLPLSSQQFHAPWIPHRQTPDTQSFSIWYDDEIISPKIRSTHVVIFLSFYPQTTKNIHTEQKSSSVTCMFGTYRSRNVLWSCKNKKRKSCIHW